LTWSYMDYTKSLLHAQYKKYLQTNLETGLKRQDE